MIAASKPAPMDRREVGHFQVFLTSGSLPRFREDRSPPSKFAPRVDRDKARSVPSFDQFVAANKLAAPKPPRFVNSL